MSDAPEVAADSAGSAPPLKGVAQPSFVPIQIASAARAPIYPWAAAWQSGSRPSKEIVKLSDFSGGWGFGNPDEADTWLSSLARAVNINKWSREEAFEHIQNKLVGNAAVWYRNREHLFHLNPAGLEAGWTAFWSTFERKFIAHNEQALWMQFDSRVQAAGESVETYADALRCMADRLGVNIHRANVVSRFLKGLYNAQVRSKVENNMFLLDKTFNVVESAAAFHEKAYRRDKANKSSVVVPEGKKDGKEAFGSANMSAADFKRMLEENTTKQQKVLEERLQRHMFEMKKEVASQRQSAARSQLDRLKGTKPDRPCFTCGAKDHFKKNCPFKLAKRGQVSQISMSDLIEMDFSDVSDVAEVNEMISRFEVFLDLEVEFTAERARQVVLVDLDGHEGGDLIAQVMTGPLLGGGRR